VRNGAAGALLQLLDNQDSAVRISAVKAIGKLGIKQGAAPLQQLAKSDTEADVRVAALKALVLLKAEQVAQAVQFAVNDKEKKVRVAGLNLLQEMNLSKELMVKLLTDIINTKTAEEKQAALLTLGKLPVQHSQPVFEGLLNKMAGGKLAPDLYLELGEAIDSTGSKDLIARYKAISATLAPDELTAVYAGSLSGGDPERGRTIFFGNQNAQCIKCHSYDDRGGNAGPRLNGVARRITRPQILEALISPSARLAPGYGVVTVTTKNGKTLSGMLLAESNSSLTLKSGSGLNEVIPKDQIAKRVNAQSSMPDMKAILSKKEIRDVVSFLSTLKEND
jgi:putative heme-binding domain-containing protein